MVSIWGSAVVTRPRHTASAVCDGRARPPATYRLSEKDKGLSTRLPDRLALVLLKEVLTLDEVGGASKTPNNLLQRLSLGMSHHYAEQLNPPVWPVPECAFPLTSDSVG
jgi:predicted ArsR family transcriptional regulator